MLGPLWFHNLLAVSRSCSIFDAVSHDTRPPTQHAGLAILASILSVIVGTLAAKGKVEAGYAVGSFVATVVMLVLMTSGVPDSCFRATAKKLGQ